MERINIRTFGVVITTQHGRYFHQRVIDVTSDTNLLDLCRAETAIKGINIVRNKAEALKAARKFNTDETHRMILESKQYQNKQVPALKKNLQLFQIYGDYNILNLK